MYSNSHRIQTQMSTRVNVNVCRYTDIISFLYCMYDIRSDVLRIHLIVLCAPLFRKEGSTTQIVTVTHCFCQAYDCETYKSSVHVFS